MQWLENATMFQWLFDFLAWGTFCWFALKDKRASSSLITLTVVLVLDGTMTNFGGFINSFATSDNTNAIRVAYYGGFALFDIFAIIMIYQVHKVIGLDYKFLARTYLLAYFVLAWCQIIRLAERLYFDSHAFKAAYNVLIGAVNMGTATASCLVALMTIYIHISNKQPGGTLWKI